MTRFMEFLDGYLLASPGQKLRQVSLLLFLVIFLGLGTGWSQDSESLSWQKVNLENEIRARIERVVDGLTRTSPGADTAALASKVVVSVQITLKPLPKKLTVQAGRRDSAGEAGKIGLGKIDLDAPLIDRAQDENAKIDIFGLITQVTINLVADERILASLGEQIKDRVTKEVQLGQRIPVTVNLEGIKYEGSSVADRLTSDWGLREWLLYFKESIGSVFSAILISLMVLLFGILVLRDYRSIEEKKVALMEASASREEGAGDGAAVEDPSLAQAVESAAAQAGSSVDPAGDSSSGFGKLRDYLKEQPDRVSALIRQWLKTHVPGSEEALVLLLRKLPTEELLRVSRLMGAEDRSAWKRLLAKWQGPLSTQAQIRADEFLSGQILEAMMISQSGVDESLQDGLMELGMDDLLGLAQKDPVFASILLNVIPALQAKILYSRLPEELMGAVTVSSLQFTPQQVALKESELKKEVEALLGRVHHVHHSPFADRLPDLLREAHPEKEASIFRAIRDNGDLDLLLELGQKVFPSQLLEKLPPTLLKAALERFAFTRRSELIFMTPEPLKGIMITASGKEGSKAREMLDFELKQIEVDEVRKKRAIKQFEGSQKDFVQIVRGILATQESVREVAEGIVAAWVQELAATPRPNQEQAA